MTGVLGFPDVPSTTLLMRQPKLIIVVRGQTCVQLGAMNPHKKFRLVRFRSPLLTESCRLFIPLRGPKTTQGIKSLR